jgi:hypothetical protein
MSLAEAASTAKASIYDMMDLINREKITPPQPTDEEFAKELQDATDIFKTINHQTKSKSK